jgi:hypothetical protein
MCYPDYIVVDNGVWRIFFSDGTYLQVYQAHCSVCLRSFVLLYCHLDDGKSIKLYFVRRKNSRDVFRRLRYFVNIDG